MPLAFTQEDFLCCMSTDEVLGAYARLLMQMSYKNVNCSIYYGGRFFVCSFWSVLCQTCLIELTVNLQYIVTTENVVDISNELYNTLVRTISYIVVVMSRRILGE